MLWCHAYNASNARDPRDARFRGPDCVEVGGRQRCHALLGSSRSRGHTHGVERGLHSGIGRAGASGDCARSFQTESAGRGSPLRQLRDMEAGGRGHHPEHRRDSGCECADRTRIAPWSLRRLVLGWPPRRRGLEHEHGIFVVRGAAGRTSPDRSDHRLSGSACSGNRTGELHRASGVRCESAGWASVTQSAQATSPWRGGVEQAAYGSALVRGIKWRATSHQSIDQSTGQTGARARTREALRSPSSSGALRSFSGTRPAISPYQRADCSRGLAGTP
jgi:hypothetical protein